MDGHSRSLELFELIREGVRRHVQHPLDPVEPGALAREPTDDLPGPRTLEDAPSIRDRGPTRLALTTGRTTQTWPTRSGRYLIASVYPVTATIRDFLENGEAAVNATFYAWFEPLSLSSVVDLPVLPRERLAVI